MLTNPAGTAYIPVPIGTGTQRAEPDGSVIEEPEAGLTLMSTR